MDKLQGLLGTVQRLLREATATLLGDNAGVADLLHMLDDGQTAHHGVLIELSQRLKVEVAEPLVPAPVDVVLPCGEAHRLRDVEVEHVEAVGPAVHLDEEAPALVSDAKHSVLDLHLGSSFIELAKTHDGVAQRQYEVDAVKNVMLAILGLEHDRANTLDLHPGRVAKPHRAVH